MGYRSDVAIAMYAIDTKDAPAIKLWIQENFPQAGWQNGAIRWFDRGMIFSVNDIRWYEHDDDIKKVMTALYEFKELFVDESDAPEGAYEYVRIGEDDSDTEQRRIGNVDWLLSLTRSIHIEV